MHQKQYGYGKLVPVTNNSNFASCCGSKYIHGGTNSKPARKWKNQYGEGITPAVTGEPKEVNMVTANYNGILLVDGKQKFKETDKFEFKKIKTKNGWLTASIRTKW